MALTLHRVIGADSGGDEQLDSFQGTPAEVTTPVADGSHAYELSPAATKEQIRFQRLDGSAFDNDVVAGCKFRITDATPSAGTPILLFVGSTGQHAGVGLNASGNLILIDAAGSVVATGSSTLSDNTWYRIEARFRRGDAGTGQLEVFLDGASEVSDTASDFQRASETSDWIYFQGAGSSDGTVYVDSIYIYDGGSSNSDFLLDWNVWKYNKTDGGASDQGDTLDLGTWALASQTPLDSSSGNFAAYTDNAGKSGGMRTDSGSNSGPSGDANVTGTIEGAEYVFNARRGSGAGTPDLRIGNSADGMTAQSATLAGGFGNFRFVSEAATIVPETNETFELGMVNTGSADVIIGDAWAMLLHKASGAETKTATLSLDAAVGAQKVIAVALDAGLVFGQTKATGLDAGLETLATRPAALDAAVREFHTAAANLDAALRDSFTRGSGLDAALRIGGVRATGLDAALADLGTAVAGLEAALKAAKSRTAGIDAALERTLALAASLDAGVSVAATVATNLAAVLVRRILIQANLNAAVQAGLTGAASLDAVLAAEAPSFAPAASRMHAIAGRAGCAILPDGRVYVIPKGSRTH